MQLKLEELGFNFGGFQPPLRGGHGPAAREGSARTADDDDLDDEDE